MSSEDAKVFYPGALPRPAGVDDDGSGALAAIGEPGALSAIQLPSSNPFQICSNLVGLWQSIMGNEWGTDSLLSAIWITGGDAHRRRFRMVTVKRPST